MPPETETPPLLVLPLPADADLMAQLLATVRDWRLDSLRRGEILCHAEELPGLGQVLVVRAADSRAGGSDADL